MTKVSLGDNQSIEVVKDGLLIKGKNIVLNSPVNISKREEE